METKSMLISLSDAKKFYPDGSPEFKVMCETTFPETFKSDIRDRIKTFQDAFDIYIKTNSIDPLISNLINYKGSNIDVLKSQANEKLVIIVKVLNQGWVPDWANTSQRKWYPYFYMSPFAFDHAYCSYGTSNASNASRLRLKSEELAIYAGQTFTEIYKVA